MTNDLISRQAAIEALGEMPEVWEEDDDEGRGEQNQWYMDKTAIEAVPTADLSEYCDKLWKVAYERGKGDAQPRKGKWMEKGGDTICPFCGFECDDIYYLHEGNYCPDCGAKLEWEE